MPESWLELAVAGPGLEPDAAAAKIASGAGGAGLLLLPRQPALPREPSDGALAHAMGALASARGQALLFAYAEACSGLRHLALQLVLADGGATANYRATHLGPAALAAGWSPGNWLTLARLEAATGRGPVILGLLGGVDHLAPEVARSLSGLGAGALIAMLDPLDQPPAAELLGPLARLRAIENGVPVCIVAADGTVHAAAADGRPVPTRSAAGLTRLALQPAPAVAGMPRRPELYRQLVAVPPG